MAEKKMKHLEMIEGVIERMGNNSFQLKGWAVTLVALVGALASQGSDKRFSCWHLSHSLLSGFLTRSICRWNGSIRSSTRTSLRNPKMLLISIWTQEALSASAMMPSESVFLDAYFLKLNGYFT